MYSKQSFLDADLGFCLDTLVFDSDTRTNVCVNRCAESDGSPAIFVTANLSRADIADSCALRRTVHSQALPGSSAADRRYRICQSGL